MRYFDRYLSVSSGTENLRVFWTVCLLLVCLSSYKCDDSFSGKHCIRYSRIKKDLSVWLTEELRLAKSNVIMHLVQLSVRGHCPPVHWCNGALQCTGVCPSELGGCPNSIVADTGWLAALHSIVATGIYQVICNCKPFEHTFENTQWGTVAIP